VTNARYLRDVQYRDSSNLAARANLHARASTASEPWFVWLAETVEWPTAARVLEVGCGPGWLWEQARTAVPDDVTLTLTDLSLGMVREAVTRVGPHFPMVRGAVADAGRLPFVSASFDLVVANHMLYHVPDPSAAAKQLAGVLQRGGVLLAATNGPAHLREVDDMCAEVFGEREQRKYSDRFGAHNGAAMLAPHFASVEWRAHDGDLVSTDPDDVLAYMRSYPPGDRATDAELDRLRTKIRGRFAAGDGALRITRQTGVFVCRLA
jgi:SAM-dependent methyltransferase